MHVDVGPNALIQRLALEELPGEQESVSAFLDKVGVER
jgi:hypothetical protein